MRTSAAYGSSATLTDVVSRRSLLVTGGAVGVAAGALVVTDRLDDVLRGVGARPEPAPDDRDRALLRGARADQAALVARAEREQASVKLRNVLRQQARGLGATAKASILDDVSLSQALRAVAGARADDAVKARSTDVAVVLASLSAGLSQVRAGLRQGR